jgi:hypothetical protein
MLNAIHDLTEKDIAILTLHRLRNEQAIWNLKREQREPGFKLFSWRRVNIARRGAR